MQQTEESHRQTNTTMMVACLLLLPLSSVLVFVAVVDARSFFPLWVRLSHRIVSWWMKFHFDKISIEL